MADENTILKTPISKEQVREAKRRARKGESQLEKVIILEAGGEDLVNEEIYTLLKDMVDVTRIIRSGDSELVIPSTPVSIKDYLNGGSGFAVYGKKSILDYLNANNHS